MKSACDYQIFQQNAQGRALVPFYGVIPAEHSGKVIWARALREDDTLDVTGWRRCAVEGDKWRIDFDLPAGGLYWLEARAQEEGGAVEWGIRIARVSHIGVGELFILAGQSNMAGYARDAAFDPSWAYTCTATTASGRWRRTRSTIPWTRYIPRTPSMPATPRPRSALRA